jgi:hypothetical protein
MRILRIKNYEKYQNHRSNNPTWIKLYHRLLTDQAFIKLDIHSRYIYVGLLILASETNNSIPNDGPYLAQRLAMSGPVVGQSRSNGSPQMAHTGSSDGPRLDLTPLFRSGLLVASRSTIKRMNAPQRERREETEREGEESVASAPPPPPKRVSKPMTEWPEGYRFNEQHKSIADGLGLNVHTEFIAFKDKALAKGYTYKDWDAGFRTWLNNAAKFKQARMTG